MPWTGPQFQQKHNHGLSETQSSQPARVANAILKKTGDEGAAIAIANSQVKKRAGQGRYRSHMEDQ
jgi:uncharacterized protein YdaT